MIPVKISTKTDNPKIVFAGVEDGAKMLVELNGEAVGPAAAAAVIHQKKDADIDSALSRPGYCPFRIVLLPAFICHTGFKYQELACPMFVGGNASSNV